MSETWIILGATSTIARAFARLLAARGDSLILAGRDLDEFERDAADYRNRGAPEATVVAFDARDPTTFKAGLEALRAVDGTPNAAVFLGSMPSQEEIDADPALIEGLLADNFTGPARFLTEAAPLFEARGAGLIIGVGSVAGDRGRIGNYIYGAAKSGFHTYLSGLRNRLGRAGVHVMTVKPGTVDTAMTWGMEGLPFLAQPEKIAADMLKAAGKRRNTLYTPLIWWPVMTVIRLIPEAIFKKLSI